MSWVKAFEKDGIGGLKLQTGRGRRALRSKDEQEIIKEWIFQDCNLTIKAVKLRIEEKFRKNIGMTTTHKLMKSLGFSYITPRSRHYKQDQHLLQKKTLKKLKSLCSEEPARTVLFFDEARFGTHSKLGHGWFVTGSM